MTKPGQRNHWDDNGDLVVIQRTLFRGVGWLIHGGPYDGVFTTSEPQARGWAHGSYSPVYEQIATDNGEGWDD